MKNVVQISILVCSVLTSGFSHAALDVKAVQDPIIYKKVEIPIAISGAESIISYTDCVEVSLLRFLQLVFIDEKHPEQIDIAKMASLRPIAEVVTFFTTYPKIESAEFYDKTALGQEIRTQWSILLARKGLIYNKPRDFEVRATIKNLFDAFQVIFPARIMSEVIRLEADSSYFQDLWTRVCDYFTHSEFDLKCTINQHENLDLGEGLVNRITLMDITVNATPVYRWSLVEFLQDGTRISGHSELYSLNK